MSKETVTWEAAAIQVLAFVEAGLASGLPMRADLKRDLTNYVACHSLEGTLMSFQFEENVWAVDASVTVDFLSSSRPPVTVTWSTTRRPPSSARAAVVLQTKVVDLACLIESYLSSVELETPMERSKRHTKEAKSKRDAKAKRIENAS